MNSFLTQCKQSLNELSQYDRVHVVIGNEACDLDSAVAALVYAFYSAQVHENTGEKVIHLPCLNISVKDYKIKTEVNFSLSRRDIGQEQLIFRDSLDLNSLHQQGKLILTLVDHNILQPGDSSLESAVCCIIDHHQVERSVDDRVKTTIEPVGSCCTLVAEKLLDDPKFDLQKEQAELLYDAILLDTVCLKVEAGRTTEKDVLIADRLETMLPDVNRQAVFDTLQSAKFDISALTVQEVLRKDLKTVTSGSLSVAISSIPGYVQDFLARNNVGADLQEFACKFSVDVVVLMSVHVPAIGIPERGIAVFSHSSIHREQIENVLKACQNPDLQLKPVSCCSPNTAAYQQGNFKATRKDVLPLIKNIP